MVRRLTCQGKSGFSRKQSNNPFCLLLLYSDYITNNKYVFVGATLILALLPFLGFLVYDKKVSRRQKQILSTAKQSDAIISSLFPSSVKNLLYATKEPGQGLNTHDQLSATRAIAELYPDTTILFAGKSLALPFYSLARASPSNLLALFR